MYICAQSAFSSEGLFVISLVGKRPGKTEELLAQYRITLGTREKAPKIISGEAAERSTSQRPNAHQSKGGLLR